MTNTIYYKIGKYKMVAERVRTYVTPFQFFMIVYLFTIESPFGVHPIVWGISILFCLTILGYIDVKKGVFEGQSNYNWSKVPMWMDHVDKTDEIMKRLDKIEKKVSE